MLDKTDWLVDHTLDGTDSLPATNRQDNDAIPWCRLPASNQSVGRGCYHDGGHKGRVVFGSLCFFPVLLLCDDRLLLYILRTMAMLSPQWKVAEVLPYCWGEMKHTLIGILMYHNRLTTQSPVYILAVHM